MLMLVLELCLREPPHPPGVPVLVPDLLLHLGVGQRLQEGRPRVGVALHGGYSVLFCENSITFMGPASHHQPKKSEADEMAWF